jgi:sec-independent protein translocase protein TatC
LAAPLCLLYELGILAASLIKKREAENSEGRELDL